MNSRTLSIERPLFFFAGDSGLVLRRFLTLAILLALEATALSVQFDNAALEGRPGLAGFVHDWAAWGLRVAFGFAALFATFVWLRNRALLDSLAPALRENGIDWWLIAGHAGAMALFTALSFRLYGAGSVSQNGLVAGWALTGISATLLLALALIPVSSWQRLANGTGAMWLLALVAVAVACIIGNYGRALWVPTTRLTYALSRLMLRPFVNAIVDDPATAELGTPRFHVEIAPECSGFEGMGLMLAFSAAWLVLFRREVRFPHALLLAPAGVVVIYLLNAVRIVALILIGNAGAEQTALGGFHSQAGWIAFNVVALVFSVTARQVAWFREERAAPSRTTPEAHNPVAPWLMPFIAILATGMLARSLSGEFEWLYGLRVLTAGAVVWMFRGDYKRTGIRVTWAGPLAGGAVFLFWILSDRAAGVDTMPAALAGASAGARFLWIALRFAGGAVTVPIAEELAFRGYLLRRLVSADFETVSPAGHWVAIAVSSVAFGLLHGDRWIAGTVAGFVYALVYARRRNIGDAIAAHAVTNALIGIDVIAFQHWHLW